MGVTIRRLVLLGFIYTIEMILVGVETREGSHQGIQGGVFVTEDSNALIPVACHVVLPRQNMLEYIIIYTHTHLGPMIMTALCCFYVLFKLCATH